MKTFSVLEDLQGQHNLWTFSLLLDTKQSSFQVQPEGNLLQGCAWGRVTVQFGNLSQHNQQYYAIVILKLNNFTLQIQAFKWGGGGGGGERKKKQ